MGKEGTGPAPPLNLLGDFAGDSDREVREPVVVVVTGAGDLLADGDTITDTNSPTSIMDLISKYAFGDVGGGGKEKEEKK